MKIDFGPHSAISVRRENTAPEVEAPDHPDVDAPAVTTTEPQTTDAPAVATTELQTTDAPVVVARRPLSGRARVWLALALVAIALLFMWRVQIILRPFVWAAVIAYILSPIVSMIQRRTGWRRGISAGIVMLVLIALGSWGIATAVPIIQHDISDLGNSFSGLNAYLTAYLPNAGAPTILGVQVQVSTLVHDLQTAINGIPNMLTSSGLSLASTALDTVLHFLTFLISTFYLLLDGPRLGGWVHSRIPEGYRGETVEVGGRVNVVLTEYLRAEIILIGIMSIASLIALTILGVHFALVLAPIVGFLEIFPIVGPFFAIGLVTIVSLIGPPNYGLSRVGFAITVALVFFIMRQLEDYLVIPKVVGHAVKLHPVIILFALLVGASQAGILGMFLAVPITGVIKVVGGHLYERLVE